MTPRELVDAVERLKESGKIELREAPPVFASFFRFLRAFSWSWASWFMVGVTGSVVVAVYGLPSVMPWLGLRWILAAIFVGFIPGFGLVQVLFIPQRQLHASERVALSVGLSMALVPMVGLLLNFSPWGIRLHPVVFSLAGLVLVFSVVSAFRQYLRLTKSRRRGP
jgi:uncharacterized membrane protein